MREALVESPGRVAQCAAPTACFLLLGHHWQQQARGAISTPSTQTPPDTCFCLPMRVPNGQLCSQNFLERICVVDQTEAPPVTRGNTFSRWLTCRTSCRGTLPPDWPSPCCPSRGWSCGCCFRSVLWCWRQVGEGAG